MHFVVDAFFADSQHPLGPGFVAVASVKRGENRFSFNLLKRFSRERKCWCAFGRWLILFGD